MAKIKLVVSATIEETFKDFIISRKTKPKTFTGYIDEIWQECIKNSDQCVVTGKKPASKK